MSTLVTMPKGRQVLKRTNDGLTFPNLSTWFDNFFENNPGFCK